jgi:glycosyltransferase involved in cell wall biosynthesis
MMPRACGKGSLPPALLPGDDHAGRVFGAGAPMDRPGGGGARAHLLHVFPSFGIGGVPLRMARVINHLGGRFRHTVIALDNDLAAGRMLADPLDVRLLPRLRPARNALRAVVDDALALRRHRPDLLLTYNWGSIEWAVAARLHPAVRHIHFEAGFGKGEADRQIPRRVLFRRWALARCAGVVVPSRVLQDIARRVWRLPEERVIYLPNGVDIERFGGGEGVGRRPDALIVGTLAPLRPEKNIARLLRAFAALAPIPPTRLVVAGDGAERPALEGLARELGIAERVAFVGQVLPESVLGTFDIFALSSDTEQMPNALLEAMAAGRAVAAVDVGDVRDMVCEENRDFIVPRDDGAALVAALARLLADPARRERLGRANRERAVAEFSDRRMLAAYAGLFDGVLGLSGEAGA